MESSRIARVLRLLYLISRGNQSLPEQLAGTLGCSKRTLYRDFKLLEDNGFRRPKPSKNGPESESAQAGPAQTLADDELAAVLVAIKLAPLWGVAPFASELSVAFLKLQDLCAEKQKARIDLLLRLLLQPETREVKAGLYDQGRFWQIVDAIAQLQAVEVSWKPIDSENWYTFRFFPAGLRLDPHGWLVIGQSELHQQVVALSISRIKHLKPVAERHTMSNACSHHALEVDPPPPS
jgi:predicted DNA-binding transcriptional regulator YafY